MSYISYDDLYDYQKDIVKKLNTSKCVWLPPSTGKTITSIWAYKLYNKGRLLILSPASMVTEWETTLEDMEISNYDIYSYNKLCYDKYMRYKINTHYDVCIIDECQHINNIKNNDKFTITMFGKPKTVIVFSSCDNQFDENGDYTTKLFAKEQSHKSMLKVLGY